MYILEMAQNCTEIKRKLFFSYTKMFLEHQKEEIIIIIIIITIIIIIMVFISHKINLHILCYTFL